MKTIKLFLLTIMLANIGGTLFAQTASGTSGNQKTQTFKVWGNCDMCKARIEKAVRSEGVTTADWNTKTKLLAVTFDPSKTNVDELSKKLASAGHDTEKYKATSEAYANLPGCCKYERSK